MIGTGRAERACRDVLAVEQFAPGMARVVTLGGCYTVDARGEGCLCEDKQYNLEPGQMCKHHAAAFLADSDDLPTPFLVVDNLHERTDPSFSLEVPDRIGRNQQLTAFADGGALTEFESIGGGSFWKCDRCGSTADNRKDLIHVDGCPVDESEVATDGGGECEECAEMPDDWPCASCFISGERGFPEEGGA